MKEIFVGSSNEAIDQATKVAAVLRECRNVEPIHWKSKEAFPVGQFTFLAIEEIATRVSGAVFLATPDDKTIIRNREGRTPRANVLFEYGYLAARLTRARVALCTYDGITLPSDFKGLTCISMGRLGRNRPLDSEAAKKIREWADSLPQTYGGFSSICQLHGYSGEWEVRTEYTKWRTIDIPHHDLVLFEGRMTLVLPTNGVGGSGCVVGTLQIRLGSCRAKFQIIDDIVDATVEQSGSIRFITRMHYRHRLELEGIPPQEDGFEPELRGFVEGNKLLKPPENGVMQGRGIYQKLGKPYSDSLTIHRRKN